MCIAALKNDPKELAEADGVVDGDADHDAAEEGNNDSKRGK